MVDILAPVRDRIRRIGGSNTQRDLFTQLLIDAAIKANRDALARALLSERLRPNNGWTQRALHATSPH